eukprot:TRINITY_DN19370_c0_g1_i1.p1 TRINITY_DN19370_c0_g1~~TRINITY_DN19370_c0_g1_i1.p1  ORF type:complete len:384 (+),score=65.44 TRINITY_DN19370_c0_g1_i1:84-1235(+)
MTRSRGGNGVCGRGCNPEDAIAWFVNNVHERFSDAASSAGASAAEFMGCTEKKEPHQGVTPRAKSRTRQRPVLVQSVDEIPQDPVSILEREGSVSGHPRPNFDAARRPSSDASRSQFEGAEPVVFETPSPRTSRAAALDPEEIEERQRLRWERLKFGDQGVTAPLTTDLPTPQFAAFSPAPAREDVLRSMGKSGSATTMTESIESLDGFELPATMATTDAPIIVPQKALPTPFPEEVGVHRMVPLDPFVFEKFKPMQPLSSADSVSTRPPSSTDSTGGTGGTGLVAKDGSSPFDAARRLAQMPQLSPRDYQFSDQFRARADSADEISNYLRQQKEENGQRLAELQAAVHHVRRKKEEILAAPEFRQTPRPSNHISPDGVLLVD